MLEFGADGKLAFGYTEVKYSVKKDGESYIATFKPVRKMTFTITKKMRMKVLMTKVSLRLSAQKNKRLI